MSTSKSLCRVSKVKCFARTIPIDIDLHPLKKHCAVDNVIAPTSIFFRIELFLGCHYVYLHLRAFKLHACIHE